MNIDSSIIIGTILDPDGVRKGVAKAEKELKKLKDVEIRADIKQSKVEGSEKAVNNLLEERERILARIAQKETEKFNTEQASRKVNQEKLAIDKKTLESKIRQNRTDRIALTADVKEQKGIASKSNLAADRTSLANTKKQLKSVKDEAIDLKNELAKVKVDIKKINAVELSKTTGLADKIKMEQSEGTRVVDRRIVGAEGNLERDRKALQGVNSELSQVIKNVKTAQSESGKLGFKQIEKSLKGISSGTKSMLRDLARWTGAMFGIRSMYLGIRKLISTISGFNAQVKTDLNYITFAIAKEFEGVVIQIVQWIFKIMNYIKYLAQAWFGINLFANATTDAFKEQENAVGGTVGKVKELKRQLAGFDEMNRLNKGLDDTGGGGGGGSFTMPSVDLSGLPKFDIPYWLMWVKDNWEPTKSGLIGIGAGLTALALGFEPLQALGIGVFMSGLYDSIKGIEGLLEKPTWDNFLQTAEGIAKIVMSVGIFTFLINKGIGAIIIGIGAIIFMIVKIVELIKENLWQVKVWWYTFLDWIEGKWRKFVKNVKDMWQENVVEPIEEFKELGRQLVGWFLIAWDGIKLAWGKFKEWFKEKWNNITEVFGNVKTWFVDKFTAAWTGIKNVFGSVGSFFGGIWETIRGKFKDIGQKIGQTIGNAFKSAINAVLRTTENILNAPIRAINTLLDVINKVSPVKIGKLNTFNLPRLASGGIINYPNHGVVLGRAIAGESGAEGVIPLTDSQMMARLGKAIGENIVLNATLNTILNARTINRETRRVELGDNFATNGGYR